MAAVAAITVTTSCRPADDADPIERVSSGRLTPTKAQALLLEANELPEGWRPTNRTPKHASTPVDPTGLSPAACASAWTSLDRTQQQWDSAPIREQATYQNSDGGLITHTITDDPALEPDLLRRPLDRLPEACASYQVAGPDGTPYTGGIKGLDLSRGNIGLGQTWVRPEGALTDIYFAYLIRHTTVITIRTDGGASDVGAFLDIVDAATKKADQDHQT
jgi:hypothetical protein